MAPVSLKIILEEGAVCRTILFNTTTTVREAHEIVLEKFYNSLNQDKAYGLFLTSVDNEKAGIWLESHRTLEYYMLRDGDSLQFICKTRNMRVRMLDGSVKTLQVDESKNVGELLYFICNKIGITNHDEYGFCREELPEPEDTKPATGTLTLKRKIQKDKDVKMEQLSKKLNTDDNVEWLNPTSTLRELGVDPTETLLLKRRLFYSDRKIDARDPVQLNLLYVQTRDNILSGRQVTTEEKAIEFAGIQCQVHFGDYDEEKHKPGFIENLAEYLPKAYASSWGIEKKIYREYRKHVGVSQLEAKYLYTKIAREHPTYGVTFFLVKEQEKGKKKMVPRLLGINANSILRLDENTKEILKVWLLTQVKSYHAGTTSFTLNFGDYSDKEYAVKTNEAFRIRDILEGYIDIIKKKLEGPSSVHYDEGMAICEDNVEKSKGTVIQTVVPQKLIQHSYVGPSKMISHEIGQEISQGTQIVTVQQMMITKKGDMKQQARSGMTGCMPEDFNRRINHLNSQSVKAVMLLADPSRNNFNQLYTIAEDFVGDLPSIDQGVKELANLQTSEDDKKKLLDDLEQIRKYLLEFSGIAKSRDLGTPENIEKAEEAAKKLAELSSLVLLYSDPKIRRRSELLRRSRNSFIADERVEATLRRASFLTIASSASKSVEQAIEDLNQPYNGPPVGKDEAMKLKSSAADKLAKLNAAVALLLAARANPNNIDYEQAVNSMKTIDELTPALIQDVKALSSTKDGDKHKDLLNQVRALCHDLNNLCNLTGSDDGSEIHKAAEKYAKASNKLIYVFNPKGHGKFKGTTDPDKAKEIIDLAKKARDRTSSILVVTSELTNPCSDPRARVVDDHAIKCADAALELLTCSQITAPTIHEPHCQSALTAAVENCSSSTQQLTSAWKPLVEEQQYQKYGKQLDEKTLKLMKTLEQLKKAYENLDAGKTKPEVLPKPGAKAKDVQRLQFVTSLSAAKKNMEENERDLQKIKKYLEGKPVKTADSDKERLRKLLAQKIAQLNAAMASLVHTTCDKENPDYETAATAIETINELNPQIIKDTRELCLYENDKSRQQMLEDIAAMCKATHGICAVAEQGKLQDTYDASSKFADSSGKLCYVFNPKTNPDKENQILDISRSACEKASEMLSKVYQLAEAVGGEDGARLDSAGTNVVSAAQGLLTVAQITAPSIKDERCKTALITSADRVSNLTQDVVSLWEPLIRNPEHSVLGDKLNKDREILEALLEKLKKACEPSSADEIKPKVRPKPVAKSKDVKRLQFVTSLSAAKHSMEEIERDLQETKKYLDEKPIKTADKDKERLRMLLAQKIAQLNAAMATLVHASSDRENPDYETAALAIDTINQLNPQIIKGTKDLCQYENNETRKQILEDVAALCKATHSICSGAEQGNLQDMYDAASTFADSSGKLCYVFNPKTNPDKENQILDISRSACEKASEMLSKVYQLAEAVGGEDGARLDSAGTNVVSAAQSLLTVAQITAQSIKDERCKSALITSADKVSNLTENVASLWEPLIQNSEHSVLGDGLNKDREILEALLEKLKKACEPSDELETVDAIRQEKQRLMFITSTKAVKKELTHAWELIQPSDDAEPVSHKHSKETPVYKEAQRLAAQQLAQLNAFITTLMRATSDTSNMDYETAESAFKTISQLTPDIIQNINKLYKYADDKQRAVMLDNIKSLCKANMLICDSFEKNDMQELNNAINKFANSSGKLCYVFNPRANSMKEKQILDLSKDACEKTSLMLSKVYELAENVGGQEGLRLDTAGAKVVDAAQLLLTTAQLTAASISDPRCQSELIRSTDTVSNLTKGLASMWEPVIQQPDQQVLANEIDKDRRKLEDTLDKLKKACGVDKDTTDDVKREKDKRFKFIETTSDAKKKMTEVENILQDNIETLMQAKKLNKNTPEYKELQHISAQKLAELNAAVADLTQGTSDALNPDYKTAEAALSTISQVTPEIVQNTSKLCEYEDEQQRNTMLEHVKALCAANRLMCEGMEKNDLKGVTDAVTKYARSSGKLYYVFVPRAVPLVENQIVGLSEAAHTRTKDMLSNVKKLGENIGGEEAIRLENSGTRLLHAAHNLLTTAQIIAPSITDERCQSKLITSADTVTKLADKLASEWEPIVWSPPVAINQPLGDKLMKDRNELEVIIGKLKHASNPNSDVVKLMVTMSAAKEKLDEADKLLEDSNDSITDPEKLKQDSPEHMKLQSTSAQKLADLNAAIAGLVQANTDTVNPDYKTTEKELLKISQLTPVIIQNTKKLSQYLELQQREKMLAHVKELCKANKIIYDSVEKGDTKNLINVANKYANCSGKLHHVIKPPLLNNSVKENSLLDQSKAVYEKTSGLLHNVEQLSELVGDRDAAILDTAAVRVADVAEELKTVIQITAPSIEDGKCQAALIASATNLSSVIEDLSSKWTPLVQDSKYTDCKDKLSKNKKEVNAMIEKLIAECRVKSDGTTKPQKPEPPVRQVTATSAEDKLKSKHVAFCKSVDIVHDSIKKAEEDLKKQNDKAPRPPMIVGAQEKLQNLIVDNLALAGVAVSRLISDMGPDHVNYDSAIKATKVLAEVIPVIVKDSKGLSSTKENAVKQEFLNDMLSLCEVSTKLCDTAKNDAKNINDVAVEFGNKAAKLLYNVSPEVHPGQEKEVIRRAKEIGDSASRLAVRGAEGAVEIKDARAHALCASATRCANSASDFMYTAKLLSPTIHNSESKKALLEVSNQLVSNIKEYELSWQPLYSNREHETFVRDLDAEADILRSLLDNFNQDLKNDKLVKRRVVEKLVIQDTPLRQLASNILNNVKVKAEMSASPEEKRKFLDYYNKLATAINDLDVANARSRNAPQDVNRRAELEEAVQRLQQICLESRIQSGDEKRFVDLMDLINDVSSDAEKLSNETMNVKPEDNKYALITIKSQADDIVKSAAEASHPPEISNDGEVADGTLIIKQFAQVSDERVDIMRAAVEEIRDEASKTILRRRLNDLKGSSDLLRFAVNSHIAAVRSATLDANQADFEELEKNIDNVLQSTRKTGNANNEMETVSAPLATATTLCGAVSSQRGLEKIPPALAAYLLEMRSKSNLADASQKLKLEEHLKRLLDLLKTHTMAKSRQISTWQDLDSAEVEEITRQIIEEIEKFNKEDKDGVKRRTERDNLNESDLTKLLFRPTETLYDDQKQLNKKLQQKLEKMNTLSGMVQGEFSRREPLRSLPEVAEAAAELKVVARAVALSDPKQRAWIEEATDGMCSTTYHFLMTAKTASRDPNNPESHRKFNEAWRLLNESINKLGQLNKSQDKMKRACNEIVQNLELQMSLLQTDYPSNMMGYSACLEPLQNQNNLYSIQNEDPMSREECSANLQYLSSMMCHSAELAAQCGYLLTLPDEHQHIAKEGLLNIPRDLNINGDLRLACLKIIRCKDVDEINYTQSNINKQVIELQEVIQETVGKIKDPQIKRDVLEGFQDIDQTSKDLRETLRKSPSIETIIPLASKLLDNAEDFNSTISRVAAFPQPKHSPDRKARSEQVIKNTKTLLINTQSLARAVGSCDMEVLTWRMFERDTSALIKSYEQFVKCIAENGRKAGFIEGKVDEKVFEETQAEAKHALKKSFLQIQYDLARKWLNKPASKPEDKSAGIQGVKNIIDLAQKMSEDMKGEEKAEILTMVDETNHLLEDCTLKYNSEKASLLLERLRELQNMLKWRVVTRVVEDFLEAEPLEDLDVLADGEPDDQKRKFILDKKVADLLAQLGKMTRTARYVADAGSGGSDQELIRTKDQMELLAPALVKAAQHRIKHPNNKEAVETYKRSLAQYSESISKLREICDRSVDPMEFAQAAGETIQRIREESAVKNDPQTGVSHSRAIMRLGLRVIEAGICSKEAQSDPELKQALAQAQGRLKASTKQQQRASRTPNWKDITAEILRTTGEVESFLGGENIFQKQPEPDQPIYAAALDLHATVREWSAKDNEIVAVAKRMAVQMARLSDYMNSERKCELLTTSKDIVALSTQVAALARKLALECSDMRIRKNLMQVCEQIPTISGQLKMLITVKGSSMGSKGTQESREAMATLVSNAQNLMSSVQEVVKAAIGASVKIMSQRGLRMKWVRRACYNY